MSILHALPDLADECEALLSVTLRHKVPKLKRMACRLCEKP